jgi:hypothetical protein
MAEEFELEITKDIGEIGRGQLKDSIPGFVQRDCGMVW